MNVHVFARIVCFGLAPWVLCLTGSDLRGEESNPWIQLFNGRDLEGWTPKFKGHELGENYLNTFRVEDGLLKVCYDQYDQFDEKFGHLFYREKFSHYVLRVEYRVIGQQVAGGPDWALRNNGLMIHGQVPKTMRRDQSFPVSLEVQLLGGDGTHPRTTGNLCTPGTHVVIDGKLVKRHCISSSSPTFHGDQWVTAQVEVHGSRFIRHSINGKPVLEYTQPQLDPTDADARKLIVDGQKSLYQGTISVQAESHPFEFRKIELRQLPADATRPE
jgi:hypothetical protein